MAPRLPVLAALLVASCHGGASAPVPDGGCPGCVDAAPMGDAEIALGDSAAEDRAGADDAGPDAADAAPDTADAAEAAPDLPAREAPAPDPLLSLSPPSQTFVGTPGQTSGPVTFTVVNVGDAPTGLLTVELSGVSAGEFRLQTNLCYGLSLPASAVCQVDVVFVPNFFGQKLATLTVSSPGAGHAVAQLTGTAVDDHLVITPAVATFPATAVGTTSKPLRFVVQKTSGIHLGPLQISISPGDFLLDAGSCAGVVTSCQFLVSFMPTSPGQKSAQVVVSDPYGGTTTATVDGSGL